MPVSNPLDILLAHNHWATRNILDACAPLTPEQFHRRFEMGPGSLHDTAVHILGAMRTWTDVLAGRQPRPFLSGTHTVPQLLILHDEAAADLDGQARAAPLDAVVTRTREGRTYKFTRAGVLVHVTTHGMHHRAQCLNMLRHVGIAPLPESSVADWMRRVDPIL